MLITKGQVTMFKLPLPTLKTEWWDLRRKAEDLVAQELSMSVAKIAFIVYWDETCDKQNNESQKSANRIGDIVKSKMIELCETEKRFAPYRDWI